MKRKKVIILIIVCFLLTGCTKTLTKDNKESVTLPISRRFYPLFKEAFINYIGVTV